MSDPLHIRYRPKTLDGVIGQKAVVTSLKNVLSPPESAPHSFLFTGPSGCGKTTLARIIGERLGVKSQSVLELDAATHTGIDSMRRIKDYITTPGLTGGKKRLVIVDECHALSKQAWQSWLKIVEEPPSHLYLVFCTTEPDKVPKTIVTRCYAYTLHNVEFEDILDLLREINGKEKGSVPSGKVLALCAQKAKGSVRQALVYMGMANGCETSEEFNEVLSEVQEQDVDAINLAKMLVQGAKWSSLIEIIAKFEKLNAESVRIVVTNYIAACLKNTKDDRKAGRLFAILDAFSEPYNSNDKLAPLMLSVGRLVFGE